MDVNQEHGSFSTRLQTQGGENAPRPTDRDYKSGIDSTVEKDNAFVDVPDADGISMLANSTFSGYTPSSIETRGLLTNRRRMTSPILSQKTASRRSFVGVCRAVNVLIPIDIDEEVTSMQASSLVKLARTVKKKEAHRDVQAHRSGSI